MEVREAIMQAIDGNAILFLGSGFSIEAINFNNESFPLGETTCKRLIRDGNIDVSQDSVNDLKDLGYISEVFLDSNTKVDLMRFLSLQFRCKQVAEHHREIAKLKWKRIYTTNYDNVFEKASEEIGFRRETITPEKHASDVLEHKNAIIHMNGYVGNVNEKNLMSTFKLLGSSYTKSTIPQSEWAISLYNDLKTSKAIIIIGYSMDYDLELQQIFASVDEIKQKCIFITFNPSKREEHNYKKYGEIFKKGTVDFSNLIKEVKESYNKIEKEYTLSCIKEIEGQSIVPAVVIPDRDIMALFLDGNIKMENIFSQKVNEYVIKRDVVDEIVDSLVTSIHSVIIHSDLGNGKSVIIREIEEKLCQKGHVYYLDRISYDLKDDLDYISELKGNKFIIVENYNRIIDSQFSKILALYQRGDFRYVFTVRSYLNENLFQRFLTTFKISPNTTAIYDVNKLTRNEELKLFQLLENYKLWGVRATWNTSEKKKYIYKKCKSEIKNVLLDLLKSNELSRKINTILEVLFENDGIKEITLFAFICNIIATELPLSDIVLILNKQARMADYNENEAVREFFNFDHNAISLKSPIVASYILQNQNYNEDTEELIKKILPILDRNRNNYENILRMLISSSNLRMIFNLRESEVHLRFIRIFERAKVLNYYKENPFFWLQYSMACMDAKDYKTAKVYLENAEAYAQSRSFDSWQIEIQKARYYLEATIKEKDYINAYDNFILAHNLIIGSSTPTMYYPLRQLTAYNTYYHCFYSRFSESEKAVFLFKCSEAIKAIDDQLVSQDAYIKNKSYREYELNHIRKGLIRITDRIHDNLYSD